MARNKYRIDYAALYPGVYLSGDTLNALKESDRKMKYAEYDLKCEGFIVDEEIGTATFLPSREDSLERLLDLDIQFRDDSALPEDVVLDALHIQELRRCISVLDDDEQKLIHALFYAGYTEKEYAVTIGISQTGVSWRKRKLLKKMKKILESDDFYCYDVILDGLSK